MIKNTIFFFLLLLIIPPVMATWFSDEDRTAYLSLEDKNRFNAVGQIRNSKKTDLDDINASTSAFVVKIEGMISKTTIVVANAHSFSQDFDQAYFDTDEYRKFCIGSDTGKAKGRNCYNIAEIIKGTQDRQKEPHKDWAVEILASKIETVISVDGLQKLKPLIIRKGGYSPDNIIGKEADLIAYENSDEKRLIQQNSSVYSYPQRQTKSCRFRVMHDLAKHAGYGKGSVLHDCQTVDGTSGGAFILKNDSKTPAESANHRYVYAINDSSFGEVQFGGTSYKNNHFNSSILISGELYNRIEAQFH